jgi:hypothetical protein
VKTTFSFFDVRVTGAAAGATLTVTFHYDDSSVGGDDNPQIGFFDSTRQTLTQGAGPTAQPG